MSIGRITSASRVACLAVLPGFIAGCASKNANPHPVAASDDPKSASPSPSDLQALARCSDPSLVWRSGAKTSYESYPAPGSEECIQYSGCEYMGLFAACEEKRSENWVKTHNIVAVFPDFRALKLHDLCLKWGDKMIVATVLDTCADSDCDGCCTENRGQSEQLIDVEKYTAQRWGLTENAAIEWADLGPTRTNGCGD